MVKQSGRNVVAADSRHTLVLKFRPVFLVFNPGNTLNAMNSRTRLASAFPLYWKNSKEPHRRPGLGGLSKPPVPVRSAHYGAKDLASVRLAWIPAFSSIPGEARVLLSSPTNAKRHRNQIPVRDGKHN